MVLLMVNKDTGEGWRSLFKIIGAAGSLWVLLWLWFTRGERAAEMTPGRQQNSVPFAEVFKLRTFWITMAVGVAVNMAWHLYRVWLPRHFVRDLKFDDAELQYLQMAYFLTADLGSILFGFVAKKAVTGSRPSKGTLLCSPSNQYLIALREITSCQSIRAMTQLRTPNMPFN